MAMPSEEGILCGVHKLPLLARNLIAGFYHPYVCRDAFWYAHPTRIARLCVAASLGKEEAMVKQLPAMDPTQRIEAHMTSVFIHTKGRGGQYWIPTLSFIENSHCNTNTRIFLVLLRAIRYGQDVIVKRLWAHLFGAMGGAIGAVSGKTEHERLTSNYLGYQALKAVALTSRSSDLWETLIGSVMNTRKWAQEKADLFILMNDAKLLNKHIQHLRPVEKIPRLRQRIYEGCYHQAWDTTLILARESPRAQAVIYNYCIQYDFPDDLQRFLETMGKSMHAKMQSIDNLVRCIEAEANKCVPLMQQYLCGLGVRLDGLESWPTLLSWSYDDLALLLPVISHVEDIVTLGMQEIEKKEGCMRPEGWLPVLVIHAQSLGHECFLRVLSRWMSCQVECQDDLRKVWSHTDTIMFKDLKQEGLDDCLYQCAQRRFNDVLREMLGLYGSRFDKERLRIALKMAIQHRNIEAIPLLLWAGVDVCVRKHAALRQFKDIILDGCLVDPAYRPDFTRHWAIADAMAARCTCGNGPEIFATMGKAVRAHKKSCHDL